MLRRRCLSHGPLAWVPRPHTLAAVVPTYRLVFWNGEWLIITIITMLSERCFVKTRQLQVTIDYSLYLLHYGGCSGSNGVILFEPLGSSSINQPHAISAPSVRCVFQGACFITSATPGLCVSLRNVCSGVTCCMMPFPPTRLFLIMCTCCKQTSLSFHICRFSGVVYAE